MRADPLICDCLGYLIGPSPTDHDRHLPDCGNSAILSSPLLQPIMQARQPTHLDPRRFPNDALQLDFNNATELNGLFWVGLGNPPHSPRSSSGGNLSGRHATVLSWEEPSKLSSAQMRWLANLCLFFLAFSTGT